MSNVNKNPKPPLRWDKNELKSIKVQITRRNISKPHSTIPLQRILEDPTLLNICVHCRPDEGLHPIFDREDVVANCGGTNEQPVNSPALEKPITAQTAKSRSSSRSSRSPSRKHSPQPHTSIDYPKSRDYSPRRHRRSSSRSKKVVYKSSSPSRGHKYSRSPRRSRERSPRHHRYRSRSPKERGRTPPKYREPPESGRSRTPVRRRSRSYSPHRRSRYSRSPDYRRYERRSRSPRRHRYTPERDRDRERHSRRSPPDERGYQPPRIPNPYFEGAEYWIPDPMLQPRFIPRPMIPPGAFPYGPFRPPIMPLRPPFRPRIVYNRPQRPRATVAAIENPTVTTTTTPSIENAAVTTTTSTEVLRENEMQEGVIVEEKSDDN